MKQLPAENKSPVLINHGCDYSAQSVALTLNTHLPCKLTQIPLYSSIYRLAEPTCSSTRPKSPGGGRQVILYYRCCDSRYVTLALVHIYRRNALSQWEPAFGKAFTECCYCKFCKWNWKNVCLAGYSH